MKILVVTQFFYPEEFKVNDLVKGMVDRGHEVTVLTGKPNYPKGKLYDGYRMWGVQKEEVFGAKVIRVPVIPRGKGTTVPLVTNYFSYIFFSCLYQMTHRLRPDKIFVWDSSPILQAYAAIRVKKKTKVNMSMWVQDLWPESVTATKGYSDGVVMRRLNKMVHNIYRHFDTLFVQSPAFEQSIREKGDFNAKYIYAPNWAEDIYLTPKEQIDAEKYKSLMPQQAFVVMFAGNVGAAQDFDAIIEAAKITSQDPDIRWVIVGDGRMKTAVEAKVSEQHLQDRFSFLGRHPYSEMPHFFVHADAMLVSLKDEYIFSLTIPSKTQAYMAAGKPILTMINGSGNDIVKEARCGLTAEAGNAQQLAENIMKMKSMTKEELQQMGDNGRQYYQKHFLKETIIDRIIDNL